MMILEIGQICPYKNTCPHGVTTMGVPCHGTWATRPNKFFCNYVIDGKIVDNMGSRLPGDKTGQMKIIME